MAGTKALIFVLLGGALGGAGAFAGDPGGEGNIQFSNPKQSVSGALGGCGQSCLYTKANDVITLETEYMVRLANRLIEEREKLGRPGVGQAQEKEARRVLHRNLEAYCRAQGRALSSSGEYDEKKGDRCLGGYLQVVARALEANRAALLKNYRVIVDLNQGAGALPGPHTAQQPSNTGKILKNRDLLKDTKWKLYPDFPFHPAFEAIDPVVKRLGQEARRQIRERKSLYAAGSPREQSDADEALANWWKNFPRCPSLDEYAKVDFVERYPGKNTGEKLPVVVTDPKTGRVVHDVPAFQAARANCVEAQKDAFREIPIPPEILSEGDSQGRMAEKRQAFEEAQSAMVSAVAAKAAKSSETKEYTVSLFGDGAAGASGNAAAAKIDQDIREIRMAAESYLPRR